VKRLLFLGIAGLFSFCGVSAQTTAGQAVRAEETTEAPRAIHLPEYESLLKQYSARIKEIGRNPSTAGEFRKSLPSKWRVQTDRSAIDVSSEELERDCEEIEKGGETGNAAVRKANEWLERTTIETRKLEEEVRQADKDRERQQLEKVFERSEFRGLNGPGLFEEWNARVARWIGKQMERIFRAIHIPFGLGRVVIWPVLVLAFGVLAYLVWRLLKDRTASALPEVSMGETKSEDRAWLKEALAAAERGQYREAVHRGYWAAISRLESREILKQDRTRTPRESLKLLETHPVERGILREQTMRLERVWYGCREATSEDWTSAFSELREMGCL
jgi:hypothetical protein